MATIAHSGDTGWQDYWKALRSNGVEVVDGWTTAYDDEFSGAAGSTGSQAARRQLRIEPAGRGDLRRSAAHRRADRRRRLDMLPSGRVRRRAARHRPRDRGTQTGRLPDQRTIPERAAAEPVRLSGAHRRDAASRSSPSSPSFPPHPFTIDPADIAANRQQWQDEWTDHRAALNRPPRWFVAAVAAAPVAVHHRASTRGRWPRCCGPRCGDAPNGSSPFGDVGGIVWFTAVAGRGQHRADAGRRACCRRTCSPATASAAGVC